MSAIEVESADEKASHIAKTDMALPIETIYIIQLAVDSTIDGAIWDQ